MFIIYASFSIPEYKLNLNGRRGMIISHIYGNIYDIQIEGDMNVILPSYSNNKNLKAGEIVFIGEIDGKYYIN